MVSSINTNVAAYFAQANIEIASAAANASVARLSSGNRIVRSSDDVAGLSIGTSLRTGVSALRAALGNTSQGISVVQVADGALSQITEILQRQKAIALQAGSGSLTDSDRTYLDQEFQALADEIDRLVTSTTFNGVALLDGSLDGVGGNFVTTDPAANTNYTFTKDLDDAADLAISAISAVAAVDATNGLNPSVIGSISNVTYANVGAADDGTAIRIRFEVNGVLFEGVGNFSGFDTTDNDETVAVLFTEVGPTYNDSHGATNDPMQISITFQEQTATAAVINSLATFEAAIGDTAETVLEGAFISQQRKLTADVTDTVAGTVLEGIADSSVTFTTHTMDTASGDTFGNVDLVNVIRVGDASDSNGQITVRINGQDFVLYDLNAATASDDGILTAGDTITLTRTIGETGDTETVAIVLTGLDATINLNTAEGASALASALRTLLSGAQAGSSGGLSFQVGAESTDTLNVSIASVNTTTIYEGVALNVLTQSAATAASAAIDTALDTVTSVRAGVGALQSRFNFAAANIQTSIQNQDAARGALLDTDIATESTSYATAQVKLQAGISVLAQANQQLQALLKLIG